jgi:hypothetical protein
LFEINVAKGKTTKPATPVKGKEAAVSEKPEVKESEVSLLAEPEPANGVDNDANESITNDDDDLILKDDCFEEVERIGVEHVNDHEDGSSAKDATLELSDNMGQEPKDVDGEMSNLDNEDSINLTIGEEEAKLFHDEDEVKSKGESFSCNDTHY